MTDLIICPAHYTHGHAARVALGVVVTRGGGVGALLEHVIQESIINVDIVLIWLVTRIISLVVVRVIVCVICLGVPDLPVRPGGQLTHDAGAGGAGGALAPALGQPGLGGALGYAGQQRPGDAGGADPPLLVTAPVQDTLGPGASEIRELWAGVTREAGGLQTRAVSWASLAMMSCRYRALTRTKLGVACQIFHVEMSSCQVMRVQNVEAFLRLSIFMSHQPI